MNAIVTGATGLLGRHLVNELVAHHWRVTAIVRPTSVRQRADIDYRVCELGTTAPLAEWFADCDVVFHAAAAVTDWAPWKYFACHTIEATRQICEAMRAGRCRRLVHVSTVGVYGRPRTIAPIGEDQPFASLGRWDYYTNSKIAAERLVWERHANGTLAATVIRPAMIYGPSPTGLASRVAAVARAGKLVLVGDPQTRLPLVHVTDVARALVAAATCPPAVGEAFNIVNDEPVTQAEFFQTIAQLAGAPSVTKRVPYRLAYALGLAAEFWAHFRRAKQPPRLTRYRVSLFGYPRFYSTAKARELLAWQPQTSFPDGIKRAVESLRSA